MAWSSSPTRVSSRCGVSSRSSSSCTGSMSWASSTSTYRKRSVSTPGHGRALAQQAGRERHLVAEVDQPPVEQQALVRARTRPRARRLPAASSTSVSSHTPCHASGAPSRAARAPRPRSRRVVDQVLGRDAAVLGAREQVRQRAQEPRGVAQWPVSLEPELEQVLPQEHDLLGTADDPGRIRQAQLMSVLSQHTDRRTHGT